MPNLGIWGNEKCVKCGACCIEYNLSLANHLCPNQILKDGKSYCQVHENTEKRQHRSLCENFFCGDVLNSSLMPNAEYHREQLRRIAKEHGFA